MEEVEDEQGRRRKREWGRGEIILREGISKLRGGARRKKEKEGGKEWGDKTPRKRQRERRI